MLKNFLAYLLWPWWLFSSITLTALGFSLEQPMLYFNLAYALLIAQVALAERYLTFSPLWQQPDGENFTNIAHTLSSKGALQALAFGLLAMGFSENSWQNLANLGLWPLDWPLWLQVILALLLGELVLYWAHRLAHEWPVLWRFHAIHHSVGRLWWLNTGRFHFVDSLISVVVVAAFLWLLGAPLFLLQWLAAITSFIGILTHCNVALKTACFSYIFNTPTLHRYHHSPDAKEGNVNYGENLMLWDQVFGTFSWPKTPPRLDIGIAETMPKHFWQQLLWPWRRF
jgi:sterol desaturase/sphingolipid hydroxylase (fatty acid hydroxylase superfamily)